MTAAPKPRTLRDAGLRTWIRGLTCLIGARHQCRGKVECCHVRTRGAGNPDRNNVFPGCRAAHDEQEGRTAAFEAKYGLDLEAEARRLTAWYLREFPDAVESPHVRPHRPMPKRRDRLRDDERAAVESIRELGPAALREERIILRAFDRLAPPPTPTGA